MNLNRVTFSLSKYSEYVYITALNSEVCGGQAIIFLSFSTAEKQNKLKYKLKNVSGSNHTKIKTSTNMGFYLYHKSAKSIFCLVKAYD